MRVQIDPALCQGHGRCYDLAPTCSARTRRATALTVLGDGTCRRPQDDAARLAAANCPESARSPIPRRPEMAVDERFAAGLPGAARGARSAPATR